MWVIEDPSNGAEAELVPGDQRGKVEANSIAQQGEDTYDAYLRIKNIDKDQDGDKTIKFVIKVLHFTGIDLGWIWNQSILCSRLAMVKLGRFQWTLKCWLKMRLLFLLKLFLLLKEVRHSLIWYAQA